MDCPRCESDNKTKDGIVKQRQRFRCKECGFRFTVVGRSASKPLYLKRIALQLYLEGLSFRAVGRILGVSNVSILNWVRASGEKVLNLKNPEPVRIVKVDEILKRIKLNKNKDGCGFLLIELGEDSSSSLLSDENLNLDKSDGDKLGEE